MAATVPGDLIVVSGDMMRVDPNTLQAGGKPFRRFSVDDRSQLG